MTKYKELVQFHVRSQDISIIIDEIMIQDLQMIAFLLYDFSMLTSIQIMSNRLTLTQYEKYYLNLSR